MSEKPIERIVTIGEKKVKIVLPSIGLGSTGDLEYSKAYTGALKAGLMPRAAMDRYVKENNLWTDKDEEEVFVIQEKLQELMLRSSAAKTNEERLQVKLEFYQTRNELSNLTSKRQSLYAHTAESKGEEAKISYLAWQCAYNEDGSKIWNSKEEFMAENDIAFTMSLLQEFIGFSAGLEEKNDLIEEIFSKEIEEEVEQVTSADVEETEKEVEVAKAEEPVQLNESQTQG